MAPLFPHRPKTPVAYPTNAAGSTLGFPWWDVTFGATFVVTGAKRMKRFVAYYRVSTKRQGDSGLGLEAQRDAVQICSNVASQRGLSLSPSIRKSRAVIVQTVRRSKPRCETAAFTAQRW